MKERPQPWAPEDDERIRKLVAEGRTIRIIAERLKRTPDAVRTRARILNVKISNSNARNAKWSEIEDIRLRELAKAGLSSAEIAVEMNRSASSVRSHAENLQIKIARGANVLSSASMAGRLMRAG